MTISPSPELPPMLVSVRGAAGALGIGLTKTYELIADRQLETVTIGARRLVKVDSIKRLVEAAATDGAA